MATSGRKGDAYTVLTGLDANVKFTVFSNSETYTVSMQTVFANNNLNLTVNTATVNSLFISKNTTPANSSNYTGTAGEIWHDDSYIYLATSNTQVKRLGPFSTF